MSFIGSIASALTRTAASVGADTAADAVAANYAAVNIQAEIERRTRAAQRVEMLHDNFRSQVIAAINGCFTDDKLRAIMAEHATCELNLLAHVVTAISVVYAWGAHRQLDDGSSENNRLYQELVRECRLDSRLGLANALANTCNEVLLRPVVRDYAGRPRMCLDVITPDSATAIPRDDDACRPAALLIYHRLPHASPPRAYVDVWTDDEVSRYEGDYHRVAQAWDVAPGDNRASKALVRAETSWSQWLDLRPRKDLGSAWRAPNPYGRIPYIVVHRQEPVDSIWDPDSGAPLVDATVSANLCMAFLRRLAKDQSEKVILHTGRVEDLPPAQRLDLTSVVSLPGGGSVADWTHDPEKLLAQVRARMALVAARYGVPEALLFLSGSGNTYGDAAVQRIPLHEVRARQIREVWDPLERDLFELMALVSRVDHPTLKIDDEGVKLRVRFSDAPSIASPVEMEALLDSRVAAGTISRLERLALARPYIDSSDEAEEVQRQIAAENRTWNRYMRDENAPRDGSPGRTPQANGAMGPLVRDGKMPPPGDDDEEADDGSEG